MIFKKYFISLKKLPTKFILLFLVLISSNCMGTLHQMGCFSPSEYTQQRAQDFFEDAYTTKIFIIGNLGYKVFGCYYYSGDEIYYYKTIFNSGYILVRNNEAITYVEEAKAIRAIEND